MVEYELISSGTHGNNVALFKCYKDTEIVYKKVALTKQANSIIRAEKDGYDWFFETAGNKSNVELHEDYFCEIDIPFFAGKSFPPDSVIKGNEKYIEMVIEFYIDKWSVADRFVIHGDMALSNVIVTASSDLYLIDWEHFHPADRAYFGFDVFNMLYILLFHQMRRFKYVSRRTGDFLRSCYKHLASNIFTDNRILEKPFQYSCDYLRDNMGKFRLNIDPARKYVLIRNSISDLEDLDSMVTR
jgi:hypothetical protein